MAEQMIFQDEARKKLLQGAALLMQSVKGTLGPCGHHAILHKEYGKPMVSNDGVTIAKALKMQDPYARMGAELILESASKTNETAGDGTTTSILLAYELLKQGYHYMEQGGIPNPFVEGMEMAKEEICAYVKEHGHKVDTYEMIQNIARISAKSEEIGTLVADALKKVEDPRCVYCESGKSFVSKIRMQEGMEVAASPLSPYFFPKDHEKLILKQPYLLITNRRIDGWKEIEHIFVYAMQEHRPLLIICEDMENDVLAPLLMAHVQKKCNVVVVKAPSFGSYQEDILDDLALLCKGKANMQELGIPLEEISIEDLGVCKEAVISLHSMQIIAEKHILVDERIQYLKDHLPAYEQKYDLQHMYHRITRLEGKLALIEIGGYTQSEIDEKKMRCEDALQAAWAAMEEGVTAGGGLTLLQAYRHLQPTFHSDHKDKEAGIQCVFAVLLKPFLQLMENNYLDPVAMLDEQFQKGEHIGYDVGNHRWCNMEEAGILDPVKVVLETLHNAISVASLLIRCDVAICAG